VAPIDGHQRTAVRCRHRRPASPAAIGDDIEQRLLLLKRLRDKGLISEEEYQHKRRDVLQKL